MGKRGRKRKRKCKHCGKMYLPDPRTRDRQKHCSAPECRRASKAWRHPPIADRLEEGRNATHAMSMQGGMGVGRMNCTAAVLDLDLGIDLLRRFLARPDGISEWNRWIGAIEPLAIQSTGEMSEAFVLGLDFAHSNLIGMDLEGIDLSLAWLADADFTRSSLRGARLGCCPRAVFKDADLTDADFTDGELTGVDFTGAKTDGLLLESASYERGSPPLGLPDALLALCHEESVEPVKGSTRLHTARVTVRARVVFPPPSRRSGMATN